jgi:hypothetical protein
MTPGTVFSSDSGGTFRFIAVWDYSGSEYIYSTSGSEATITEYVGAEKINVVIPQKLDEKSVTAVGADAFSSKRIYSLTLADTIRSIGKNAFADNYLEEIIIPDSVVIIDKYAFMNNNLRQATFGRNIKTLREYAFRYNNNLETISLPDSLTTIEQGAFYHCELREIRIGNDVSIEDKTALGNHGEAFLEAYDADGNLAGTYIYNDVRWVRQN